MHYDVKPKDSGGESARPKYRVNTKTLLDFK